MPSCPSGSYAATGAAAPQWKVRLRELVNDELGLAAALMATLGIAGGEPLVDPIAAIVVATIIAYGAIGLMRENVSILLGASPEAEALERIRAAAPSVGGVLGIHDLRAEYRGPKSPMRISTSPWPGNAP